MPIRVVATGRVKEGPSRLDGDEAPTVVFVLDPFPGPGEVGLAHACEVVCRGHELAMWVTEGVQPGQPVTVNGEPMAGTSGPITLAGSAAVGNAEILAGLVVNQLLEPGRPSIYNLGLAHVFDMRTAIAVTGAPENALFACLSGLMGRFYQLPSASWLSRI